MQIKKTQTKPTNPEEYCHRSIYTMKDWFVTDHINACQRYVKHCSSLVPLSATCFAHFI